MSTHFPFLKPRQVIALLKAKGFEEKRITGSHHIFRHPVTGKIVPVPMHGNKDIKKGTLRSILKMADVAQEELGVFLRK